MLRRRWKYLALLAMGGVAFQAVGCSQLIMDVLINNVLPLVVTQVLTQGLTGGTSP